MITVKQAKLRAQRYVGARDDVVLCAQQPAGVYGFGLEGEYYFEVQPKKVRYVGGNLVVAVNKITGKIREAGTTGD